MNFFYYCFYRISSAYKRLDEKHYIFGGRAVLALCQSSNLLTLIAIIAFMKDKTFIKDNFLSIIITVFLFFYVSNVFVFTQKRYDEFFEIHENENNKKKKGYGVVLYIIISLIAFIVSDFYFIENISD